MVPDELKTAIVVFFTLLGESQRRLYAGLDVLVADLSAQRERLRMAESHRSELQSRNLELVDLLREMGPAWTAERLASFDASLPATEDVRARQREQEQATATAAEAQRSLQAFKAQGARVDDLLQQVRTELDPVCLQPSAERVGRLFTRLAALNEQVASVEGQSAGRTIDRGEADLARDSLGGAEQERRS